MRRVRICYRFVKKEFFLRPVLCSRWTSVGFSKIRQSSMSLKNGLNISAKNKLLITAVAR